MTTRITVAHNEFRLAGTRDALDSGAGNATIELWEGTRPASIEGASGAGTLVSVLTLTKPCGSVAAGVLSAGHARALLALEAGAEAQEELAARIVAEGLSVRATEGAVTLANRNGERPPTPPRRKPIQMPGLQEVAERLSGTYDTRVMVSLGKRKGKIVVEFGSVEDLQRIVALMDPSVAG